MVLVCSGCSTRKQKSSALTLQEMKCMGETKMKKQSSAELGCLVLGSETKLKPNTALLRCLMMVFCHFLITHERDLATSVPI